MRFTIRPQDAHATAPNGARSLRSLILVPAIAAASAVTAIGVVVAQPMPAFAQTVTAPTNTNQAAASWLASQLGADGLLPGFTPGSSDIGSTLQAIIGFAATGTENTAAQTAWAAVTANLETAIAPYGSDDAGRMGLVILAAVALGQDPTNIAGVNVIDRLLASQQASGLFGSGDPSYDGAFRQGLAVLALEAAGAPNAAGSAWLTDQQCADGSWTAFRSDTTVACPPVDAANYSGPDTNSTALAVMALAAGGNASAAAGVAWLQSVRTADGGFPYYGDPTQPYDANSTALSATAIRTASGSADAAGLAAIVALQVPCDSEGTGGIAFQTDPSGSLYADVFATGQSLWALSGVAFPVVDATLTESVAPVCASVPPSTTSVAPTTDPAPTTTPDTTLATIELVPATSATTSTTTSTTLATTTSVPATTSTSAATTTTVAAATSVAGSTIARTGNTSGVLGALGFAFIGLGAALILAARTLAGARRRS